MTYPDPEPITTSQIHEYKVVDALNDVKELLKEQILLLKSLQKDPYPIGSLYLTSKATNPSTYFGGTWVLDRIINTTDSEHYLFHRIE